MTGPAADLTQAPRALDQAPLLERLFEVQAVEGSWDLEAAQGELPGWLRGTYYVNGPGRFALGDVRYQHWLDGDGLVCSLRFAAGKARLNTRFVHSNKRRAEGEAGRALFRTFGTSFPGDQLKRGIALESPANVSAYRFAGKLLAFGEQGLPYELDPEILETVGEHTFGGRLNPISPLAAHPCFDDNTGEMFNFGISFSARQPCLHLYRFSAAQGELLYRRRVPLHAPCSVHDFALSPRYVIFYLAPYTLDLQALMESGATIQQALRWQPEQGSRLLILDRESASPVANLEIGQGFCLHHINAFETEDRLVVDVVELDRPVYDQYQVLPDLFEDAPAGRPTRLEVDTASWQVVARRELAASPAPDFPAVDPRQAMSPYQRFWMLGLSGDQPGRKFFDRVISYSWEQQENRPADQWVAPPNTYLGGEPVLMPDLDREPGQGLVICQAFDAEHCSSAFLLLDASDLASGPVAVLDTPHPLPSLFHAAFYPD